MQLDGYRMRSEPYSPGNDVPEIPIDTEQHSTGVQIGLPVGIRAGLSIVFLFGPLMFPAPAQAGINSRITPLYSGLIGHQLNAIHDSKPRFRTGFETSSQCTCCEPLV